MIGKSIASYRITGALGKGGMGEVYRAHDSKLGRDVAIKLLPDEVGRDPERLARFQREAKLLASLNHPNIAALYDLKEANGRAFLVMELAEGEDLSRRLERGPVPVEEALTLARQIAEGLEAAHKKGIVHRDLKPANVMLTEGGVKLLDFGLARAYEQDEASGDPETSPTITTAMTRPGVILGTAAYMSPEQARGRAVGKQTDIWAFGAVVYEMLTGHRLFGGETISDSIGAILHREPDWDRLPAEVPRPVRRLLRRCLQRDRAHRLRDIGDALIELREEETDAAAPAVPSGGRLARNSARFLPWIIALLSIAVAATVALTRGGDDHALPLRKLTILPITNREGAAAGRLSPDGRRVAYVSGGSLWIRDLDQTTPRRMSDVKGWGSGDTFWSPDGRWLAFVNDDRLWKVAMDGSAPTLICDIPTERRFISGAWDVRDRILLGQWRGGLLEASANGGTIREVMKAPDDLVDYHSLSLLPDGESLLGSAHLVGDSARAGESTRLDVIRNGKIVKSLTLSSDAVFSASYAPTGHIVFSIAGRGVWAVPFSLDKLDTTGEPFVIDPDGADPSVARDGSLVYSRNINRTPGRLVRFDMSGKVIDSIGETGERPGRPLFSPDGSVLAYSLEEKGDIDVWTLDLTSGITRRLTQFKGFGWPCSWASDGTKLLVARRASDWAAPENGLYLVDITAGRDPARIGGGFSGQLLPDGSGVLYWKFGVRNDDRLEWKRFGDGAEPKPVVESMKRATAPALSPDGALVAFESDDSGEDEIWAARFPGGEGRVQVSSGGGRDAVWSRDGRSLYYRGAGSTIYRVPVNGGARPGFGAPRKLFDGKSEDLSLWSGFDVLPDGSGFVTVQRLPLEDAAIVYVQNWLSEFQERP